MAEPVSRDPVPPEPARRPGPQAVPAVTPRQAANAEPALPPSVPARTPAQEMLQDLIHQLEELKQRLEREGLSLKRELSQDAEYVKRRARYYHEHRPFQALGMVAMATFAVGLILGLWRR